MAQEWYYAQGDKKVGPLSARELKQAAMDGTLKPTDLVWTEGMKEWREAQFLKKLAGSWSTPPKAEPPPLPHEAQQPVDPSIDGESVPDAAESEYGSTNPLAVSGNREAWAKNPRLWIPRACGVCFLLFLPPLGTLFGIYFLRERIRKCPACESWGARVHIETTEGESQLDRAYVSRHDQHYDTTGNRSGTTIRTERVDVVHTELTDHYQCRFCGHLWDLTYVESRER